MHTLKYRYILQVNLGPPTNESSDESLSSTVPSRPSTRSLRSGMHSFGMHTHGSADLDHPEASADLLPGAFGSTSLRPFSPSPRRLEPTPEEARESRDSASLGNSEATSGTPSNAASPMRGAMGAVVAAVSRATGRRSAGSSAGNLVATDAPVATDGDGRMDDFGSVFVESGQRGAHLGPSHVINAKSTANSNASLPARHSTSSHPVECREDSQTLLEASVDPSERIAAAAAAATDLINDRVSSGGTGTSTGSTNTSSAWKRPPRGSTRGAQPPQGGAAVVKTVMEEVPNAAVLLQCADELVFRLPRESVQTFPRMLRRLEVRGFPSERNCTFSSGMVHSGLYCLTPACKKPPVADPHMLLL